MQEAFEGGAVDINYADDVIIFIEAKDEYVKNLKL